MLESKAFSKPIVSTSTSLVACGGNWGEMEHGGWDGPQCGRELRHPSSNSPWAWKFVCWGRVLRVLVLQLLVVQLEHDQEWLAWRPLTYPHPQVRRHLSRPPLQLGILPPILSSWHVASQSLESAQGDQGRASNHLHFTGPLLEPYVLG